MDEKSNRVRVSEFGDYADWIEAHLEPGELRQAVRVTSIQHPEAVLMTPEQSVFLRENVKLRLLNARLSLLSRHSRRGW